MDWERCVLGGVLRGSVAECCVGMYSPQIFGKPLVCAAGPMRSSAPTGLYVCAVGAVKTVGGCRGRPMVAPTGCVFALVRVRRVASPLGVIGPYGTVRSPTAYCLLPTASDYQGHESSGSSGKTSTGVTGTEVGSCKTDLRAARGSAWCFWATCWTMASMFCGSMER